MIFNNIQLKIITIITYTIINQHSCQINTSSSTSCKMQNLPQIKAITPQKSPNDKCQYQALILPNQLKILLIYNHQIKISVCSISVGVGNLLDNDRSLGLAHFLQHMLFMGSKKFPKHNEYAAFINMNSGCDNAYTDEMQTNYYFSIKNNNFPQAVQRLTNYFSDGALLSPQQIKNQLQSVHEQFVQWSNDDNCRRFQVFKQLASKPFSRFNIGNIDTLSHQHIRSDLVEFYDQYYSANIINAVVYSNEKIKNMKKTLVPFFEAIPNKNVQLPQFSIHYQKNQTGKLIMMQSIKDQSVAEFFFIIEYLKPLYKKHIQQYINHVIGHQGKNSLLSILKQKKYGAELQVDCRHFAPQTIFIITLKLTKLGQQSLTQVYNITMDYLSTLQASNQIYQQLKQKNQIQFKFKEKDLDLSENAYQLSSTMHHVPLNEILNHSVLFEPFDENTINRVLSQLNPFNVIVVVSSSNELKHPITQQYLGGKYQIHKLPKRNKSGIDFLPLLKNRYLPIDTTMYHNNKISPTLTPKKIRQNIDFIHDNIYKVCKGGIQLFIYSHQDFSFLQFYMVYLSSLLTELTYPAEMVGCQVKYSLDKSLNISVFGFSDTVQKLLSDIAEQIHPLHQGKRSQTIFEVELNELIQSQQNTYNQQSIDVSQKILKIFLTKTMKSIENSIKQYQGYNYKQFNSRIKLFWTNCQFKWVVVGNFQEKNVNKFIEQVQGKIKGKICNRQKFQFGCVKLTDNITHSVFLQSEELNTSCAIVYYQAGPYSQPLYYKLLLLRNYINQPFYNQLRTLKQMAYELHVRVQKCKGVLGLSFILASSTKNPKLISDEIQKFVDIFFGQIQKDLGKNNCQKLTTLKQSVLTKINQTSTTNLQVFFEFIVDELEQNTNYFTRKQSKQLRKHLDPITINDLTKFWNQIKSNTLQLHIISKKHKQKYFKYSIKSTTIQNIKSNCMFWDVLCQC